MCCLTARGHRRRDRAGRRRVAAQREQRRPGTRQAAAERAGVGGRPLDLRPGPARAARAAARRSCPRASATSGEVRAVQRVDERAEVGPLPDRRRRAAPSCRAARAPAPFRSRDPGCTTTAVRPAGTGSRTTSGGFGTPHEHEAAVDRRRDVVAVRRSGAEPLALRARTPSASRAARARSSSASTATTAATALAALPPRPLDSGSPLRIVSATPRRSPSDVSSACAATPAVFRAASRGRRPLIADDVVDPHAGRGRAAARHLVAGRVAARSRARRSRTRRSTRWPAQRR